MVDLDRERNQSARLCDFVRERLDELEADAPLLSQGLGTGCITQTWLERDVRMRRVLLRTYEDNRSMWGNSIVVATMKVAIFAIADAFSDHPDYKRSLWGS